MCGALSLGPMSSSISTFVHLGGSFGKVEWTFLKDMALSFSCFLLYCPIAWLSVSSMDNL